MEYIHNHVKRNTIYFLSIILMDTSRGREELNAGATTSAEHDDQDDDVFADDVPCFSSEQKALSDEFIRTLANDYIHFKIFGNNGKDGEWLQNTKRVNKLKRNLSFQEKSTLNKARKLLRKTSLELEREHADFFEHVVTDTSPTAEVSFRTISEEVLSPDKLNWGRVVSLFVYGGKLAEEFWKTRQEDKVEEVEEWITESISQRDEWINEQGGWNNFNELFQSDEHTWYQWLVPPLLLLAGATVATFVSMMVFK